MAKAEAEPKTKTNPQTTTKPKAQTKVHTKWAALHEPRGAAEHHSQRFIAGTGSQNQMFGKDVFGASQDLKSTCHPCHFDQSVVAEGVMLFAKVVQHHPWVIDVFLEVVNLVVSKTIGWVHHLGPKGGVSVDIAPHPKV